MVCASANRHHHRLSLVAGFLVLLGGALAAADALAIARLINIEETIRLADRIFRGTVVSVEEEHVPALALVARVKVEERLKGDPADVVPIRQRGRKGPKGHIVPAFEDLPKFQKGERVLVFLSGENDAGFSVPIGLGQGVFRLVGGKKDPSQDLAVNALGNGNVFRDVSKPQTIEVSRRVRAQSSRKGDSTLTLGSILELVRAQAGASR